MKRALVFLLPLLAACSVSTTPPPGREVEMVVPASLADTERVAVQRRGFRLAGDQLKFGDWQVFGYRQGWRSSPEESRDFGPIEQIATRSSGRYQFGLRNSAGDEWTARCVDRTAGEGVRFGNENDQTTIKPEQRWSLACDMVRGGEKWTLRYDGAMHAHIGSIDRVGSGELTNGTRALRIVPEYELRNVPIRIRPVVPVGYVLKDGDRDLAAVNRDEAFAWVRFANDVAAEDRDAIAAAAAALLLQQQDVD